MYGRFEKALQMIVHLNECLKFTYSVFLSSSVISLLNANTIPGLADSLVRVH